jgi:aldehyde dehydrogenase (NAD(P)+)
MSTEGLPEHRRAALDAALAELGRGEITWARTPLRARRLLLERVGVLAGRNAQDWVTAATSFKGLSLDSAQVGEEWMSGPYGLISATTALAESLRALERGGSPVDGFSFGRAPGGRVTVRCLPHTLFDRLLLNGFSAEIWLPPGVDEQTVRARAGLAQRSPTETNGVGLVLGAGNVTTIPVLDVLSELYAGNRVAVLKLNPIMDPFHDVLERVLQPFIELGVLRVVLGDREVGDYLARHERVGHVHLTGSATTHDAVVFGVGPEAAERRRQNRPILTKDITSELGGVCPIVVLPGNWSRADLRYQAEHVVTQRLHNGGYNCVAGQVLVLSSDWAQKDQFLAEVRAALTRAPTRPGYYPGSTDRIQAALTACPTAEQFGSADGPVLIHATGPADRRYLLNTECFAPVLGVIELPGTGQAYLTTAVETANQEFTGTLGINVIAHPASLAELGEGFENALAGLRYGSIAINAWTGVSFLIPTLSWGSYPGNQLDDVQSGVGVVHNSLLIEHPERSVLRGPFRPSPRSLLKGELSISPKPPWFVGNRTAPQTGRALTAFAADPGLTRLARVLWSAVRG